MFIIRQGGGRFNWQATPIGEAAWVSACVGAAATLAAVAVQWLVIRKRVAEDLQVEREQAEARRRAAVAAAAAFISVREPQGAAVGLEGGLEGTRAGYIKGCLLSGLKCWLQPCNLGAS